MQFKNGFTLIELMITVMVVAILAAIALPNYAAYMQRKDLAVAKQEALRFAAELERFRGKNFSYKNFDATYLHTDYDVKTGKLYIPVGSSEADAKYILTLFDLETLQPLKKVASDDDSISIDDTVSGLAWGMTVLRAQNNGLPKQPKNYDLGLNSHNIRCMSKTAGVVADVVEDKSSCGSNSLSENW